MKARVTAPGYRTIERAVKEDLFVTMTDGTQEAVAADVLVVDDTPANLKLLTDMLKERGYRVRPAPSGRIALKAARQSRPDLVLLDVNMPEMNGYEVCAELKSDASLCDIPVIFISALNETMDKVKAFRVGGVDYVTKPFQFEEVEARVQTHLKLRRLQRELEARNEALRRSYDDLQELEALRDNLVHMIVHDMRSPIMGVQGNLQLLESGAADVLDETSREDLSYAIEAAKGLNEMISSLLDVSRLEAGEMPVEHQPCDLRDTVADALEFLGSLTREHEVVFDRPGNAVMASCDAELIRRVITNLVGNAIKFTPLGGRVSIVLIPGDDEVRVEVVDTGPGIPEAYQDRVFDKFGQVAARQNRKRFSTGLGLTFCKLAVEAHGGGIGVVSEEGEGSTFWFTLPVAQ